MAMAIVDCGFTGRLRIEMFQPKAPINYEKFELLFRPYGLLLVPLILMSAAMPIVVFAIEAVVLLGVDWAAPEARYKYGEHYYVISMLYCLTSFVALLLSAVAFKKGASGLPLNMLSLFISMLGLGSRVLAGYAPRDTAPSGFYTLLACLAVSAAIYIFERAKARRAGL